MNLRKKELFSLASVFSYSLLCSHTGHAQENMQENTPENLPENIQEETPEEIQEEIQEESTDEEELPSLETKVLYQKDIRRVVGAAYTIDEKTLDRQDHDDIQRVLRQVPGVYVRDEDGFGLRPNIGMRGVSSDRSAKIVLLEDGVLLAPAPYSAPAAYYFPITARLVGVDVYKGPASIRQGPHTVGGALNVRTRGAPLGVTAGIDTGIGFVDQMGRQQHRWIGFAGIGDEYSGVLLEAARIGSDGFKQIDGDPHRSTGFVRDDLMLQYRLGNGYSEAVSHRLELKLGLQREISDETYLGLSDADFRENALRRYAASSADRMEWWRTQLAARYQVSFTDENNNPYDIETVFYRNDLDRTWNKINGLRNGPNLHEVMSFAELGANPIYLDAVKSGILEILGNENRLLLVGPNERRYFSQGISTHIRGRILPAQPEQAQQQPEQRWEIGVRLHQDAIQRRHSEKGFYLRQENEQDAPRLVDLGETAQITARNQVTTTALAMHITDEIRWPTLTIAGGVRSELIYGVQEEYGEDVTTEQIEQRTEQWQWAVLPGIGTTWQPIQGWQWIAGIHRGFSPTTPQKNRTEITPETSTNVEMGTRIALHEMMRPANPANTSRNQSKSQNKPQIFAEAFGFYNRYDNIIGECTYSVGCIDDIGGQENGGAADIYGTEVNIKQNWPIKESTFAEQSIVENVRVELSYTWTQAVFATSFRSNHPLFGQIDAGDLMAYIPAHQIALSLGYTTQIGWGSAGATEIGTTGTTGTGWRGPLDINLSIAANSAMLDGPANQQQIDAHNLGNLSNIKTTDAYAVVDLSANWHPFEEHPQFALTTRIDNLIDDSLGFRPIVSRRPFGARPQKPRSFLLGVQWRL